LRIVLTGFRHGEDFKLVLILTPVPGLQLRETDLFYAK
jgi:hypothetical protein